MDFFNSQYFKTNKRILRVCGLWSYESNLKSKRKYLIFIIPTYSMVFAMMAGVYTQENAEHLSILETAVALIYCSGAIVVCKILYWNRHEIKEWSETIAGDWIKLTDDSERKIMGAFLLEARSAILVTAGYGFPAFGLFICVTFLPRIFNKESLEQCIHSFPYYFKSIVINENTCNLQVCVHFTAAILFSNFAFLSVSVTYITSVKHVCGLYGIACYRLRNAVVCRKNINPLKETLIKDTSIIPSLIKVIDIHKEAIRNIKVIERRFSHGFFFLQIGALVLLTILIFEVNYYGGNIHELLRFLPILLLFILYVFFMNWCGEQVIQSCDDLRTSTYNIDWYRIPSRVRIFVLMIMLRTTKPVHLTAGTVMLLSIENFATILKTAWSFGMLLLTTQKPGRNKDANFLEY